MALSIPNPLVHTGICLLSSKMLQMPHARVSARVQMTDLQDKIKIFLMIYDGNDNPLQINVSSLEPVITPIAF